MREEIDEFLGKMQLLSLGVLVDNTPYSSSAFYAYDKKNSQFIIAGDDDTTHIKALKICDKVSGTVALDTKIVGKIQGVQFLGEMIVSNAVERKIYFEKFPFAIALNPKIYSIKVNWAKFTNNRLGFGKKLIWERDAAEEES